MIFVCVERCFGSLSTFLSIVLSSMGGSQGRPMFFDRPEFACLVQGCTFTPPQTKQTLRGKKLEFT